MDNQKLYIGTRRPKTRIYNWKDSKGIGYSRVRKPTDPIFICYVITQSQLLNTQCSGSKIFKYPQCSSQGFQFWGPRALPYKMLGTIEIKAPQVQYPAIAIICLCIKVIVAKMSLFELNKTLAL